MSTISVSAPGKVLLLGGYLVLDAQYTGLVLTTSARFHCIAKANDIQQDPDRFTITACSPQFPTDRPYMYQFALNECNAPNPSYRNAFSDQPTNNFIDQAIHVSLLLAHAQVGQSNFAHRVKQTPHVQLTILANNDFYSFASNRHGLKPFSSPSSSITKVKKTGLGSSAALVTSVIASIARFFDKNLNLNSIHYACQLAHCLAQMKVGSGFDISSAVFGSQIYQRFCPAALTETVQAGGGAALTARIFTQLLNEAPTIRPFKLPPQINLVLVDVSVGSHTPSLISKVQTWKLANPQLALQLYGQIQAYQTTIVSLFNKLSDLSQDHQTGIQWVHPSMCPSDSSLDVSSLNSVYAVLDQLYFHFNSVRECMRRLGQYANVPIEPIEQTQLLDHCLAVDGVIGVGVPGAGGYDAIYILHVKDLENLSKVESKLHSVFANYPNVTPLTCTPSHLGLTDDTDAVMPELESFLAHH